MPAANGRTPINEEKLVMKKVLIVILTFVCGVILNTLLCGAGLFFGAFNVITYILVILAFGLGLAVAVNNAAEKFTNYLAKPAFIAYAEAPLFVLVLANFLISLYNTKKTFVYFTFFGRDYTRTVALNMLITSAVTITFTVVVAAYRRKKRKL